jgi:Bifunctional DNA primase/polymerase, N-terminal/Primase C terminal 2 (PriCT-2)
MKRPPRDMLEAVLLYVELFDWEVFPVPPGTKKSYKSARFSNGVRWGATNKPAVIKRDFKRWPKANLGIPTGIENGFWVLEADTPKGHDIDGIASLRALERNHGRLPKTLMVVSPSGSLHYYFKWPKGKLIICNSASKIAPGIDVRGEGGMVVAPPSIKEGVGQYRWLNWGTAGAYAPNWLLDLVIRKPKEATAVNPNNWSYDSNIATGMIEFALGVIQQVCAASGKWPYQVWFEIGCALHFELGDEGFAIFDAWSRMSPTYNAAHCVAKWRECAKINTFKIGTILHYANLASPGWRSVFDAQRWAKFTWAHR